MAMYKDPEESYPSPTTPSGLLPSPSDMSIPSSSTSTSSSLSSSGHFPLFKPSLTSQQNPHGSGGQKPRPSPLSLHNSFHSDAQEENGVGKKSPSFLFQPGSPTSVASRDSTTSMDITGSPRAASARLSSHQSRGPMSSAASTTSSTYYSIASSPRSTTAPCSALCHHSKTNYHQHHSSCLHKQHRHGNNHGNSHHNHHPACQHHNNKQQSDSSLLQHGPKLGRATKGINRFGLPQFHPEMDLGSSERLSSTTMKTTSTSTSGSGGYGMRRGNHDEDEDMDGMGSSYASEPPKKRLRSTASMLIDAAVETVIFTGAVALSAYQLLTGKGKQGDGHSRRSSFSSEDEDGAHGEAAKAQEEDPMEEKLTFELDTSAPNSPRKPRPFSSSGSLGRQSRVPGYHKAKTPRSYRSRHSYSAPGAYNSGHTRSPSTPVRPNTGTEDSDETFLRMEAQLNSLIAEGKRALNSRIEVWDEE
ncbi:hypothetical protein BGX27_002611 [Mortierella sp. AM989]|nr:hypothetical protein BGX27_002611 [Mortierella sp. AM989]